MSRGQYPEHSTRKSWNLIVQDCMPEKSWNLTNEYQDEMSLMVLITGSAKLKPFKSNPVY